MELSAVLIGNLGTDPRHLLTKRLPEVRGGQGHDHFVLKILHPSSHAAGLSVRYVSPLILASRTVADLQRL